MSTPSIQSLVEAYQEVYEAQEGRRSPEERKARAKQLGDRQTIRKIVGDYNKGRADNRKEDPEKYITKEEVIGYLMDEGYANNEVSAEVMIEHMSDEWLDSIIEGYKQLPVGKMMRKATKHGEHAANADETGGDRKKHIDRANKMANVAQYHTPMHANSQSDKNKKKGEKPFDGHPTNPWPSYGRA